MNEVRIEVSSWIAIVDRIDLNDPVIADYVSCDWFPQSILTDGECGQQFLHHRTERSYTVIRSHQTTLDGG